jgi:hypothetical protein
MSPEILQTVSAKSIAAALVRLAHFAQDVVGLRDSDASTTSDS